jgi:hypothetical protein
VFYSWWWEWEEKKSCRVKRWMFQDSVDKQAKEKAVRESLHIQKRKKKMRRCKSLENTVQVPTTLKLTRKEIKKDWLRR